MEKTLWNSDLQRNTLSGQRIYPSPGAPRHSGGSTGTRPTSHLESKPSPLCVNHSPTNHPFPSCKSSRRTFFPCPRSHRRLGNSGIIYLPSPTTRNLEPTLNNPAHCAETAHISESPQQKQQQQQHLSTDRYPHLVQQAESQSPTHHFDHFLTCCLRPFSCCTSGFNSTVASLLQHTDRLTLLGIGRWRTLAAVVHRRGPFSVPATADKRVWKSLPPRIFLCIRESGLSRSESIP